MLYMMFIRFLTSLIPGADLRYFFTADLRETYAPKFVRPDFDLVLDGFPRSANTYSYYLTQLTFPNAKIAHHIHSWQQFLFARIWGVQSILLLRNPDDAVASLITKKGGLAPLLYLDYAVTTVLSSIFANKILAFEEATDRAFMKILFNSIGDQLGKSPVEVSDDEIRALLRQRTNWKNRPSVALDITTLSFLSRMTRKLAENSYVFANRRK